VHIPKHVVIGGMTYQVESVPTLAGEDGRMLFGQCVNSQNLIQIHGGIAPDAQEHTFFHELLHAIVNVYELKNDTEELVVTRFATVLYDTLKRNGII